VAMLREVCVYEIKEVLRLWVRGEGLRSIERLSSVDRKTVRRYVAAAVEAGLERSGGEGQLNHLAPRPGGCPRTPALGTGQGALLPVVRAAPIRGDPRLSQRGLRGLLGRT